MFNSGLSVFIKELLLLLLVLRPARSVCVSPSAFFIFYLT